MPRSPEFDFSKLEDQQKFEELPKNTKKVLIDYAQEEAGIENNERDQRGAKERKRMEKDESFKLIKETVKTEIESLEKLIKERLKTELPDALKAIDRIDGHDGYLRAIHIYEQLGDDDALNSFKESMVEKMKGEVGFAERERERELNDLRNDAEQAKLMRSFEFRNKSEELTKNWLNTKKRPVSSWLKYSDSLVSIMQDLGMTEELERLGLSKESNKDIIKKINKRIADLETNWDGERGSGGLMSGSKRENMADTIGDLFMQKGDTSNAKIYYAKYLNRVQDNEDYSKRGATNEHLAYIHMQLNDLENARKLYKTAIEEYQRKIEESDDRNKYRLNKSLTEAYEGLMACDRKIIL